MIDFKITILGCGSAVPSKTSNPSAQIIGYRNKWFLIDCGEGTQMRMIKYNVGHRNLDHIFISHLHGDHFFGLVGLLSSFHLLGRKSPLNIYAPGNLESLLIHHFETTSTILSYSLVFIALEDSGESVLCEDEHLTVKAFPLKHSTPTWGFIVQEKEKRRRIDKAFVLKYAPTVEEIIEIIQGKDFITKDGSLLHNHDITNKPSPPRAYAYCSDTAYSPSVIRFLSEIDLLYHEATFGNAQEEKAHDLLHSTAAEAAKIADQSCVKKLLIGHFSGMYTDHQLLLEDAKEFFTNTHICQEGATYTIPQE